MANIPRSGFGDFVAIQGFNEPMNPLWQPNWDPSVASGGVGDFVPILGFNEPMNPFTGMSGCACGSRRGMGAVAVPGWAATLPAPLNGVDPALGVPWVYWGLGAGALLFVVPMLKKGRR